jgi:hypothetical protein
MKILYTLGNFVYSGHQVLLYTINAKNESEEEYQQFADKCFAASFGPKNDMFVEIDGIDANEAASPPAVSDIIWTHTSGNQYIGAGIWQEVPGSPIDFDALKLIVASARKKAEELGQLVISMPLLTRDGDLDLWNFVYPIIENEFKGVDVQVIVHIPTEEQLLAVLDNMGGEFNKLQMEQPKIKFV